MPGHPTHGPMYLAKGVINVLNKFPWTSVEVKTDLYITLIAVIATFAQVGSL
jgi:hypothetical protein